MTAINSVIALHFCTPRAAQELLGLQEAFGATDDPQWKAMESTIHLVA
jgi:hypothetical protein